jgi:hypothetical protein
MDTKKSIDSMFSAGAHFGLGRSRRHPTVAGFIFGTKNSTDIFDLEKTEAALEKAESFISTLAKDTSHAEGIQFPGIFYESQGCCPFEGSHNGACLDGGQQSFFEYRRGSLAQSPQEDQSRRPTQPYSQCSWSRLCY